MNRKQFLYELEQLLKDIPDSERAEAIQYYNDYFYDAGAENEAQVIEELESPEQVAKTIREGMSENGGEYTENGYKDTRFQNCQEVSPEYQKQEKEKGSQKKGNPDMWKFLCVVLLCILLCPIVLPLGAALLAVMFAVIIGVFGIGIGAVAAGIALPIAGIAVIGYGIYKLFLFPAAGITLSGIGCLILAVGILVCLLVLWIFSKVLPAMIRGIVFLIRYPFRKAGIIR